MPFDDHDGAAERCPICGQDDCGMDTMCIHSPPGTAVVFLDDNGYDAEREEAAKILTKGQRYEVRDVDVDSWYSNVILEGVPGSFNTVMFGRSTS